MDSRDIRNLKKRYLIWLYKTTKESVDRIERKFTQSQIDRMLLAGMMSRDKARACRKQIADFKAYVENKEREGALLKYEGKGLKPEYAFLAMKLRAIEQTIVKVLGRAELARIKSLYEEEMTGRILRSTEH